MKKIVSIFFLCMQFFLACYATSKPAHEVLPIASAFIAPLDGNQYFAVDSREGVRLLDEAGKTLLVHSVNAELLDWRDNVVVSDQGIGKTQFVAATVLLPEQQPALFVLNRENNNITELVRLPIPAFKIENICLSRDQANNLSIYLLDERGTAEHWLVLDATGRQQVKKIRSVPIPPNSKSCKVDDVRDLLFIAEEATGIWMFGADAETAPGRKVIDMVKPFGQLGDAAELLAVIPSGLAVYDADTEQLMLYREKNRAYESEKNIAIGDAGEIESLAVTYDTAQQQLTIFLFDENKKHHIQMRTGWHTEPIKQSTKVTIASITADAQTDAMARFGDAADDPAIWVNKKNPRNSRVIGTNKQQGLFVYDLQGKEVQHFNTGKLNNVDVRYGIPIGKKRVDIAVATNRDDDSLAIYLIDPSSGKLSFSGSVKTELEDIYGLCLYQSSSTDGISNPKTYAIPNGKSGEFQQIELTANVDKKNKVKWSGNPVRRFFVKSQPEGCVADDKYQRLFIGEEDVALWTLGAEVTANNKPELVLAAGDVLAADVEGVGIYHGKQNSYVVVSSQGNNTFVVMDALPPFNVRGVVRIDMDAGASIDGVSETDGLEVSSANFGGVFSEGLLVVQDGHKVMPEAPQNFKYIAWEKVRTALKLD